MSDSNQNWTLTDPDTNQFGRQLSKYRFEFKEDERQQAIIDLERYSWKEIADVCEAYYGDMDELFRYNPKQSCWIIAECLFEMNVIKS